MTYETSVRHHEAAAIREEEAAVRALSPATARPHTALAAMHRHEAARKESVRRILGIAFPN